MYGAGLGNTAAHLVCYAAATTGYLYFPTKSILGCGYECYQQ